MAIGNLISQSFFSFWAEHSVVSISLLRIFNQKIYLFSAALFFDRLNSSPHWRSFRRQAAASPGCSSWQKRLSFPLKLDFFFNHLLLLQLSPKSSNWTEICTALTIFSLLFPKPDNSHFLNKDISSTNNFRFGVVDVCPSSPFAWQANDEEGIGSFSNAPRCARYQNTTSGQEQMKEESYRHKS